ncbi:MAG: sigma-54-dependent Fis family transcriptional regulator [Magnetococcales bacterium]|nr:sigma-54-dependent Fis family transcriptional regulator [Magnetococcales bacterium]
MNDPLRILVVNRDKVAVQNLEHILARDECAFMKAFGSSEAILLLNTPHYATTPFDVIIVDLERDALNENHFFQLCQRLQPTAEVIFFADPLTVPNVVQTIRQGAFHYLVKPLRPAELRHSVSLAGEQSRHKQRQRGLRQAVSHQHGSMPLLTRDPQMLRLLEQAKRAAAMDLPVLITGSTGTGKEILARLLHDESPRAQRPFVAVNCGAFHEELLANELFGHGREAYTGAVRDRKGLIEAAHGGTLFLDEITEMPLNMQVKLLRVIQEKELRRLGVTTTISVDVRFIAATNRPIRQEVEEGRFRQDLYYRLNVIDLHLPPLAQRQGDIPLLVNHFLDKYGNKHQGQPLGISQAALQRLQQHSFPGNVRELENIMQRAAAFACHAEVTEELLPDYLDKQKSYYFQYSNTRMLPLAEMEQQYILWVCEQMNGNQTLAAKVLGLDRISLWRRLKKIQSSPLFDGGDILEAPPSMEPLIQ